MSTVQWMLSTWILAIVQKIKMRMIHGDLFIWMENWLIHGRLRVVGVGCYFSWRSVTIGVPQDGQSNGT